MLVSLTQNDGAYDSKYAAFERIIGANTILVMEKAIKEHGKLGIHGVC